ncbi:MAG TPA: FAD-binding protein [Candidatus Thermoplasmatota archaeon]|nr:FAD-binding protein [Candidatus Thermoplasmatota archaeon]
MDILELALNPRKANLRFSPFSNKLPEGMGRKLEYAFGDFASTDEGERLLYSRDAASPPALLDLALKRKAWAVVRPQIKGDLFEIIKYANRNFVPIVPRGAGTSGYGGAVPTEGGIVVDLRDFKNILKIDKGAKTATVEAGVTFRDLENALAKEGLALRQYPTNPAGTIGGWIAQSGGGVGSAKYGPFRNDLESVTLVTPDGRERELAGDDLDLVYGAFGVTGFITEATLKVREAKPLTPYLLTIGAEERALSAIKRLSVTAGAYSLHFFTPEFAEMTNEAAGGKILPANVFSILAVVEGDTKESVEIIKGVAITEGGDLAKTADAERAWNARFDHLNLKRLGPSVVVSEAVVPAEAFTETFRAARDAVQAERQCFWAIAVAPREFDLIYYGLDDDRRPTYPTALGNSLAVIDIAKAHGGRSYATGVLQANEAESVVNGTKRPIRAQLFDPMRHLVAGIGGIVGGATLWLAMALVAIYLGEWMSAYGTTWAGAANLMGTVTLAKGEPSLVMALARAAVLGAIAGFILAPPAAILAMRRGEPIINLLIGILFGSTAVIGLAVLGLVGPIIDSNTVVIDFILVIVIAGAFGSLLGLPLGLVGAIALRKHQGRLGKIQAFVKATDKREVFNPGPVLGARMRGMPLRLFPIMLATTKGQLKMMRGQFKYGGGAKADPGHTALQRAIGRSHAGDLASVEYETQTCIFCAQCNLVAPEAAKTHWESGLPRGRVIMAKNVLAGKHAISPVVMNRLARTSLAVAPDLACPAKIPIAEVTDRLLAVAVETNGALPAHAALAANVEKEGNVLGKPKDQRAKWAAVAFESDARTLYFADDVGSYDEPTIALAGAQTAMNAGVQLAYLGKAERSSGAALFETGQREAAKPVVVEMLQTIAKRNIHTVLSPDANALRAMRLHWPAIAAAEDIPMGFETLHTSVALARYVKEKRLEFEGSLAKKVAYHAPEALPIKDRAAGAEVLKAMGATLVDLQVHDCGHGRGLHLHDAALVEHIAGKLVRAAQDAGVETLVTANPGCASTLKAFVKKAKLKVEILDLHEVVAKSMKAKEGAAAAPVAVVEEAPKAPVEPVIPADHYRVEFVKEGVVLAVHKNQNILAAGEEAGLELPSSCKAGSCDTCSAKWEGTPADQSAGAALSADQQKTYVLTCIARPRGPVRIWSDERP